MTNANPNAGPDIKRVQRSMTFQDCLKPALQSNQRPSIKQINDCVGQWKRDVNEGSNVEEVKREEEADEADWATYIIDGDEPNAIAS